MDNDERTTICTRTVETSPAAELPPIDLDVTSYSTPDTSNNNPEQVDNNATGVLLCMAGLTLQIKAPITYMQHCVQICLIQTNKNTVTV